MNKRLTLSFIIICVCAFIYAGDVAAFVDIGFSSDGQTYLFGQYGSLDKSYEGYAEIFTVDIDSNTFVKDGVFKTQASSLTKNKSGLNVYKNLVEKNQKYISSYNPQPATLTNTLYLRNDSKSATEEIVFKDFERSSNESEIFYHLKLVPWYSGKTVSSKSSFFISIEKQDANGKILYKDVAGTPDIKRTGVISYAIEKIMCDKTCKNIVLIIEKKINTNEGLCIRYMVETISLK